MYVGEFYPRLEKHDDFVQKGLVTLSSIGSQPRRIKNPLAV